MRITVNGFNLSFPNLASLRLGERKIRFRIGSRIVTLRKPRKLSAILVQRSPTFIRPRIAGEERGGGGDE